MGDVLMVFCYTGNAQFISLGHEFVWKPPGNDMQRLMKNERCTILDDTQFEWLNVGSDRISSGKASQKSDWNCGYMEDKNVSVSLLQMKNLDGTNTPYIAKDVRILEWIKFDPIAIKSYPGYRGGHIQELFPQNYQAADDSKKNIHTTLQLENVLDDKEIFYRVQKGKTRKSGKASQKSDWNCGYMEDKNVSVSLLQMKNLDGTNTPYIAKDVRILEWIKFDPIAIKFYPGYRGGHIQELFPQNYQAADDSKKNIHTTLQLENVLDDKEIFYRVQKGKTRKIPDLENNMVNPMKTLFNTERYVRGSNGNPNDNEMDGDTKMSCAMAFKRNLKYQ
ncbi:Hypothetical predicted protein [Mytilus galloprovincialis]|uniref:Uncharacterized protein n=1 Tax=Mytilus galloprovincialis TaxID=29158 RepID=A0A8B6EGP6_MYTGA|nr:Hypothetical predicted protein [Mytilus galloprovincialis]